MNKGLILLMFSILSIRCTDSKPKLAKPECISLPEWTSIEQVNRPFIVKTTKDYTIYLEGIANKNSSIEINCSNLLEREMYLDCIISNIKSINQ